MVVEVERETGTPWHAHPGAYATFRQAILQTMAQHKPEGDARFGPRPHRTSPYDDPAQLGTQIAIDDLGNP